MCLLYSRKWFLLFPVYPPFIFQLGRYGKIEKPSLAHPITLAFYLFRPDFTCIKVLAVGAGRGMTFDLSLRQVSLPQDIGTLSSYHCGGEKSYGLKPQLFFLSCIHAYLVTFGDLEQVAWGFIAPIISITYLFHSLAIGFRSLIFGNFFLPHSNISQSSL